MPVEEGASFENAFASQSLCCPSRATTLTGLYAHNSGIKDNKPPDGGFEKLRDEGLEEGTFAVRLQEGGYRTVYFGKNLNGYPGDDSIHVPPDWDKRYGKLDQQSSATTGSTRTARRSPTATRPRAFHRRPLQPSD